MTFAPFSPGKCNLQFPCCLVMCSYRRWTGMVQRVVLGYLGEEFLYLSSWGLHEPGATSPLSVLEQKAALGRQQACRKAEGAGNWLLCLELSGWPWATPSGEVWQHTTCLQGWVLQLCTRFCWKYMLLLQVPGRNSFSVFLHCGLLFIHLDSALCSQLHQCMYGRAFRLLANLVYLVTDVIFSLAFGIFVLSRAGEFLLESCELYLHNKSVFSYKTILRSHSVHVFKNSFYVITFLKSSTFYLPGTVLCTL